MQLERPFPNMGALPHPVTPLSNHRYELFVVSMYFIQISSTLLFCIFLKLCFTHYYGFDTMALLFTLFTIVFCVNT